jgi:hypothetical protein
MLWVVPLLPEQALVYPLRPLVHPQVRHRSCTGLRSVLKGGRRTAWRESCGYEPREGGEQRTCASTPSR